MNSIKSLLIKKYKSSFLLLCGVMGASLVLSLFHLSSHKEDKDVTRVQISDMIPSDFVMVPIELENHTAISDLISSHGVVDLYRSVESESQPYKVAQAVRILRSLNDRFTVLIPESHVPVFLHGQTLFYAVVQNSKKSDSQIHSLPLKNKRQIIVGESIFEDTLE